MGKSQQELVQQIIEALDLIDTEDAAASYLISYLYTPNPNLSFYLEELDQFLKLKSPSRSQQQNAGYLLEKIALLAFSGLKGYSSVKSFQSAGPQHDLLICGDTLSWRGVCKFLYLDIHKRSILVEAKAVKAKIKDNQFARFCNIMDCNITESGLGVFFTLNGASGFPENNTKRQRKISDSRLRQVIYYAKSGQSIVVLDKHDILQLNTSGSLIQILVRKIRDLRNLSGITTPSIEDLIEVDLPLHLKQIL